LHSQAKQQRFENISNQCKVLLRSFKYEGLATKAQSPAAQAQIATAFARLLDANAGNVAAAQSVLACMLSAAKGGPANMR
jgi:hypothetical protein